MTMHADSFFTQGKSHKICQDYARHVAFSDVAVAALSDGCSGSPDTDFGARLLVMEMLDAPTSFLNAYDYAIDAVNYISGLPDTSLDATQLWLEGVGDEVLAGVVGDGVGAARRRDGTICARRVRFKPGNAGQVAAGYAAYLRDSARLDAYLAAGCNTRIEEVYVGGALVAVNEEKIGDEDGLSQGPEDNFALETIYLASEHDFVAIFSDGIESFEREVAPKKWEAVPFMEVLAEVMAVKNATGEFVQRRCQKFFRQFCVEKKWRNQDDFSMAAVWCGP